MQYTFVPPRHNLPLLRFIYATYPFALRAKERVRDIVIEPDEWRQVDALRGKPALVLSNHPSLTEPPVLFGLARRMDERWYYMASSELFEGWVGSLINNLGAFSIRQGTADRESLKMSQEILVERRGKIAILPEAEPGGRNSKLSPFHSGAVQTAFWSAEKIQRQATESGVPGSLHIVPVAIRYRFVSPDSARAEITAGLRKVEEALGIGVPERDSQPLTSRMQEAARVVLAKVEAEYDLSDDPTLDDDSRIARIFDAIERRICGVLSIAPPKDKLPQHRQRALYNALFDFRDTLAGDATAYGKERNARRTQIANALKLDVRAFENLMSVDSEQLTRFPTLESVGELLRVLEKEVWRGFHNNGHTVPLRDAHVRIAPPVDVLSLLDEYRADKRGTVVAVNSAIEATIRDLLIQTEPLGTKV